MKKPPLPDYKEYRNNFIVKGLTLPLKEIESYKDGILKHLPSENRKEGWPWNDEVKPNTYSFEIKWPKITVVSPSYNQGAYFEETIRSILLQNYPNLEYIIMDGGSSDNTKELVKKYSSWISYWQSEKDRGQSHAINQGFSIASGEIFCWLNSDDYFTKGVLKTVAEAFISSKAKFVYGNGYNLKDDTKSKYFTPIIFDRYLVIPGIVQPSTFWKASIHQPIWEELHCTLDFELWMRMLRGVKKKYINQFLSVARIHGESKTHSTEIKLKDKWQEDHEKQWIVHGPVPLWDRYNLENRYIQKVFNFLPFLKRLF